MGQAPVAPTTEFSSQSSTSFFGSHNFNSRLVSQSWLEILSAAQLSTEGTIEVHGMTLFQDCFFDILREKDRDGEVVKLMSRCKDKTKPGYKPPALIMIVIVRFISSLTNNERESMVRLQELGRSHQRRHINRSHVETFRDVLLITIQKRLLCDSSSKLIRAWSEIAQFCIDSMYSTTYQFYRVRSGSDGIDGSTLCEVSSEANILDKLTVQQTEDDDGATGRGTNENSAHKFQQSIKLSSRRTDSADTAIDVNIVSDEPTFIEVGEVCVTCNDISCHNKGVVIIEDY